MLLYMKGEVAMWWFNLADGCCELFGSDEGWVATAGIDAVTAVLSRSNMRRESILRNAVSKARKINQIKCKVEPRINFTIVMNTEGLGQRQERYPTQREQGSNVFLYIFSAVLSVVDKVNLLCSFHFGDE